MDRFLVKVLVGNKRTIRDHFTSPLFSLGDDQDLEPPGATRISDNRNWIVGRRDAYSKEVMAINPFA